MGSGFAAAGRKVGMDCVAVAKKAHAFNYAEPQTIMSFDGLQSLADHFKIVVMMHTCMMPITKSAGQKWAVFHGGSRFRNDPARFVREFNKIVDVTLIQTGELLGFGGINEKWLQPPVDTDYIRTSYSDPGRIDASGLVFGHYPRSPTDKGSAQVLAWINGRVELRWSKDRVLWEENIKRMAQCDIYVEKLGTKIKEWGVTALEAASLGKVVVTEFASKDRYEKEYGCACPIVVANNPGEAEGKLKWLLSLSGSQIVELQKKTRAWAENIHGYEAVGERLKRLLIDA